MSDKKFGALIESAHRQGLAGQVIDPDSKGMGPNHRWRILLLQQMATDEYHILIEFRTRAGEWGTILFPMDYISEPWRVVKLLEGKNAWLGASKAEKLRHIEEVVASIPERAVRLTSRPGFVDDGAGFVMPSRMYGSAKGRYFWDPRVGEDKIGETTGTCEGYRPVLEIALNSPLLTAAILIALAAPLPSYFETRNKRSLIAEGAIYHFSGPTSTGKSLLSQTINSVFGAPTLTQSFDITPRAICELAARSNDLVLVIDDSEITDNEADCYKMMTLLGRLLPRGYSKAISQVPSKNFPSLRWSCLGVTSGPTPSAELARSLGRPRLGQAVRFFDLPIPEPLKGGIFGGQVRGTDEGERDHSLLLTKLARTTASNHGVLFAAWIKLLLRKDHSTRVEQLVSYFVQKVGAQPGAEERAARKFGILYAAGVIGVANGLLPWPSDWPFRAVEYLYRRSREVSEPENAIIDAAMRKFRRQLKHGTSFPRLRGMGLSRFTKDAIGVIRHDDTIFVCKDRLHALGLHDGRLRRCFIDKLRLCAGNSPQTRASVQLRVKCSDKERKIRFWEIGQKGELLSER